MGITKSERTSARVLQWIARVLGSILCTIVLIVFIGNIFGDSEVPDVEPDAYKEIIPTIIILTIWMAFFIIGWFNELVGAIGTIIMAITWSFPIYFTSGNNKMGMFLILPSPFLITGLLFLIAMNLEKFYQKKKS